MKFNAIAAALLATGAALTAPSAAHDHKTITALAVANENLSTLETAVIAAGLDGALAGEGPYTVLAPTNDAFAAMPDGLLDAALADPNGLLTAVLTYHVIEGDLNSGEIIALANRNGSTVEVPTLNGETLTVMVRNGKIKIQDVDGNVFNVVKQNINASNGTIHVIDGVLLPVDL